MRNTMKFKAMNKVFCFAALVLLLPALSWAGGSKDAQPQQAQQSQQAQPAASDFWTGDGGKEVSLAILAPKATGLEEKQGYLPTLVQGELVSNFSGYSAISVLDRVRLEEHYAELESGIYSDNAEAVMDFGHLLPTTHLMTGTITRTETGYALQIQIARNADKITAASYSGTFTFADLDTLAGIRRASLDLLPRMGVALTDLAREQLSAAASFNHVSAQTALAQGITAQRQGTEVAALSYFLQAGAFDSTLLEALSRTSTLSANISGSNVGDNVRNDIQWRNEWVARLTETEQFFTDFFAAQSMPFTLFYTTEIAQGRVNYQNNTVALSVEANLHGFNTWLVEITRSLQTVHEGLQATKRASTWGLGSWPRQSVTRNNPFTARKNHNFTVNFELVNDRNEVIGTSVVQTGSFWDFKLTEERPYVNPSRDDKKTVPFTVNANAISDRMTIRVASVNGIDAETAARTGVLQIRAIPKAEFDMYSNSQIRAGSLDKIPIPGNKIVDIPDSIWGEPVRTISSGSRFANGEFSDKGLVGVTLPDSVTWINSYAFYDNKLTSVTLSRNLVTIAQSAFKNNQLTHVTIPDSVTAIYYDAFSNNQLTSISIGKGITTLGEGHIYKDGIEGVFERNRLTHVTIPDNVTTIGQRTFNNNPITSITIGANVTFEDSPHVRGFDTFYNGNGKKAGTYTYNEKRERWSFKAR